MNEFPALRLMVVILPCSLRCIFDIAILAASARFRRHELQSSKRRAQKDNDPGIRKELAGKPHSPNQTGRVARGRRRALAKRMFRDIPIEKPDVQDLFFLHWIFSCVRTPKCEASADASGAGFRGSAEEQIWLTAMAGD